MSLSWLVLAILAAGDPGVEDVVVADFRAPRVTHTGDFAVRESPFVLGQRYLAAQASAAGAAPGRVRVKAPPGRYYVYLAWARHPKGASDVRVRVAGVETTLDQTKLACGLSPDDFPRNHMEQYEGLCTSGLYRITPQPVALGRGDSLELVRSDTEPGTFTTLNYVVFSPHLYLDDLGSDAQVTGKPLVNLRDYGPAASGTVGLGIAFLEPKHPESLLTWQIPADGLFLLSACPNRGPNRAAAMPLEIELSDGTWARRPLVGRSEAFGRAEWQELAVVRAARGAKLRVRPAQDGHVCPDLLRLTPIPEADVARPGAEKSDTFTVQWEEPSDTRPWLRTVRVVPLDAKDAKDEKTEPEAGLPHGVRIHVPRQAVPVLGAKDGACVLRSGPEGRFRIELADDYGLTLSTALLRREPFVWLADLGIFACAGGDFAGKKREIAAVSAQVEAARKRPFRSTSEQYFAWTGYDEARGNLVDRAFEFAYDVRRPPAPRTSERLARMPEASYPYFCQRIADVKHRRMFLGWPNVCQEFYLLSNGAIGASSAAARSTGHAPAHDFLVEFGLGDPPAFPAHGDPAVEQSIEDGYHIVVHTRWSSAATNVHATAFAYPLAGEEVRTGNEPLAAFVRLRRSGGGPLWLRITPPHYGTGAANPLAGLDRSRFDQGRLMAAERIVLAMEGVGAAAASGAEKQLMVRLDPDREFVDLFIPYVAVDAQLVDRARQLGFEKALAATKRYWDARLSRGATVAVPDPVVVNQYKTLLPRTLVTADLDVDGNYALKTSPLVYDTVWLHATAYGIAGLCRRGHFDEARQYLEAGFRWQGSQASEAAKVYTTWDGFFNAPPRYPVPLWLNYHGWFQWAAARYFLFSDDKAWLEARLPALIKSIEWTRSQRRLTMIAKPDGSQPINYGWLPAGRVTDGSHGTGTFTDCVNWMGFQEVVRVLERIGHARAAEFRKEADDYRQCILRGLKRSAVRREPVRLNDGTFVPYVPAYLESEGHERNWWYAAIVDGGVAGLPGTGAVPPGNPLEDWYLQHFEDNLFVMAPNLADEGHFLGQGLGYLRRDQPELAIYTFYSCLATQMARQTMTTYEHRSHGAGRVYDLAPWPLYYYSDLLAGMLCYDGGEELVFGRATPRAWLEPGREIRVERLQTRFGPTSFLLQAKPDRVSGVIELPTRYRAQAVKLRIRTSGKLESVKLNGRTVPFDATGMVVLPAGAAHVEVDARIAR